MGIHVIIPARYDSARFRGKLLADLGGKPVLQWTYEAALQWSAADSVWVAAADERIAAAVRNFGGKVFLSKEKHESGTERCAEAAVALGLTEDIIVNLQGDEPFVRSRQMQDLVQALSEEADLSSLCCPLLNHADLVDPNCVKVVMSRSGRALYFSRAPIPHQRDVEHAQHHLPKGCCYKHIGLYAFRAGVLPQLAALQPTLLERVEKLEQLRWLQHGFRIQMAEAEEDTIGIDTEEDLAKARALLHA